MATIETWLKRGGGSDGELDILIAMDTRQLVRHAVRSGAYRWIDGDSRLPSPELQRYRALGWIEMMDITDGLEFFRVSEKGRAFMSAYLKSKGDE